MKVKSHASFEIRPCQAAVLLNPEASRTNVSEEIPYNWQLKWASRRPTHHKELLEHNGTIPDSQTIP
jgi:hypothetical protein